MTSLIDTSVLLAYAFTRDANHDRASRALRASAQETRLVATPILTELFYMTMVRINYKRAVQMFAMTCAAFEVVELTTPDMIRMQTIMKEYEDAQFDFADTALMALAERLNIAKIYTFDRRDFSVFRPRHCDYFELLP